MTASYKNTSFVSIFNRKQPSLIFSETIFGFVQATNVNLIVRSTGCIKILHGRRDKLKIKILKKKNIKKKKRKSSE